MNGAVYSSEEEINESTSSDASLTNTNDGACKSDEREGKNARDVTAAVVDHKGAVLVNEYWGVSLEVPESALPVGVEKEIYFVITDPRLCDNAPPLDFENGTAPVYIRLHELRHERRSV